jgi:hypothetical protein
VCLIPLLREPESVNTGSAPYIENDCWRWRKLAREDCLSTEPLQFTMIR